MTPPTHQRMRVLIGAASFVDAVEALHIANQFPHSFYTSLGGLLIEEPDTFAVCTLPNQHVISQSGTAKQAPALSEIRCMIAADARAFKQSIAMMAGPQNKNTQWVFEQNEGNLVTSALRTAAKWDILILGHRKANAFKGNIITLTGPRPMNDAMEMTAQKLSLVANKDPIGFFVAPDGGASQSLHPAHTQGFRTFEDCLAAIARTNALAVLVDLHNGPVHNHQTLSLLLEAARCPVIVFGTLRAQI